MSTHAIPIRAEARQLMLDLCSDDDLMEEVQKGSEAAFSVIVQRYFARLMRIVYRFSRDWQRAEDLTQETLLRVYQHRHNYRPGGKLFGWMAIIAANLARNDLRHRKLVDMKSMSLDELPESGNFEVGLVDPGHGPEEDLAIHEIRSALTAALRQLPQSFRETFVLRNVRGLSYETICALQRIPPGTVRSRLNRARQRLRALLEPALLEYCSSV